MNEYNRIWVDLDYAGQWWCGPVRTPLLMRWSLAKSMPKTRPSSSFEKPSHEQFGSAVVCLAFDFPGRLCLTRFGIATVFQLHSHFGQLISDLV